MFPSCFCRQQLFNAIETMPCVMRKAQWALNWINPERVSGFSHDYTFQSSWYFFWKLWPRVIRGVSRFVRIRCEKYFDNCGSLHLTGILRWEDSGFCCCGRNLFLWFFCCHFLAKKEVRVDWNQIKSTQAQALWFNF